MEHDSGSLRTTPKGIRRARLVEQVFTIAVAATTALAMLVLTGWLVGARWLQFMGPAWTAMKPNTAVGLLLTVASLLLLRNLSRARWRIHAARALGTVVLLLGVLTLSQDLFGWELGIDDLVAVAAGASAGTDSVSRMAPASALAFALIGIAVLLRTRPHGAPRGLSDALAITVASISYLAVLTYLYDASHLFPLPSTIAMTRLTAGGLLLLATAVICLPPHGGLVRVLVSEGLGGHVVRQLLPAAVIIPTVFGTLRLAGEAAGFYDTPFGTASHVVAVILLFSAVAWRSAVTIDRLDRERLRARHEAEAESTARELERRRLRTVLEVLPVGVFLVDASGRIYEMNDAARAIWGRSAPLAEDIAGYARYRAWWPHTRAEVRAEEWGMARSLTHGEVHAAEELEIQSFDGHRKTILNYSAPIRDARAVIVGGVSINVDITDRKLAEMELRGLKDELELRVQRRTAELAAANAELEAFSYSVSHDLRAPLRWVDGFSQALVEDYGARLDATGQDYVRQIRESVQRMSALIDALLRLSRITRAPLQRAQVDLSRVAQELVSELRAAEPSRRVECEIGDDMRAFADPRLVQVVLDNLLRNAWKFTRQRDVARIRVGVVHRAGEQIYFVGDDGAGFDMAYVDKLFRSFERLHRSEEFEGTGVGLALVRRVVQRHGGRVWAEGRRGEGATFYFTLGPAR